MLADQLDWRYFHILEGRQFIRQVAGIKVLTKKQRERLGGRFTGLEQAVFVSSQDWKGPGWDIVEESLDKDKKFPKLYICNKCDAVFQVRQNFEDIPCCDRCNPQATPAQRRASWGAR